MFRKFADRLSAAASNAFSSTTNNGNVDRLAAMGFDRNQAVQALDATNGNVDQAAELLLASAPAPSMPPSSQQQQHVPRQNTTTNSNNQQLPRVNQEEEDLRRALEASLDVTQNVSAPMNHQPQKRTAAMQKAAAAAEARNKAQQQKIPGKKRTAPAAAAKQTSAQSQYTTPGTGVRLASQDLAVNHPGVKVIPKLQDKTVEEQILRCADRVKASPAAVDTLYKACVMIRQHPEEQKYRMIDTSNPGFQRSLAPAPGALDFLKALNFQSIGPNKLLLSFVDPARLYLAISALEQTKETPEYIMAKQRIQLTAEFAKIQSRANSSEEEAMKRAAFLVKVPVEPPEGRGAWMQITLADHETIRRRFEADDTLQDVLHWTAANYGPVLLEKLVSTREWTLQDVNQYPQKPLDCVQDGSSTLQYLGCWPSGRLEIMTSTDEWKRQQQAHDATDMSSTVVQENIGMTAIMVPGSPDSDDV